MNNNNTEKFFFHKDTEILLSDGTFKKVIDIEENDILLGMSKPSNTNPDIGSDIVHKELCAKYKCIEN